MTRFPFCAVITTLVAAGCGPKLAHFPHHDVQPVEGQVNWNGKPLAGALVTLYPQAWKSDPATGAPWAETAADGRFQLTTYSKGDGAPLGPYLITVHYRRTEFPRDGNAFGPNVLPKEYESPETSGLSVEIVKGLHVLPLLDLRGEFQKTGIVKKKKKNDRGHGIAGLQEKGG